MDIRIVSLRERRKEVTAFVRFSEAVYRNDARWVPPLIRAQASYILSGPFNRFGEKRLLLAYRGERPVARLSVQQNFAHDARYGAGQGFFGFFEALRDSEAVRTIFEAGEAWLRARGCRSVLGPMSFSIYEEMGLLVQGFDEAPAVLCPYNPPYYAELLEGIGYQKEIDWFGYRFDRRFQPSQTVEKVHRRVVSRDGLRIRPVSVESWNADAAAVRSIFNEAWAENWGHLTIENAQWAYMAGKLRMAVIQDMSFMIEVAGHPVGFLITVKDMNQALKEAGGRLFPLGLFKFLWHSRSIKRIRIIIMGVLKAYQYRGYELALAAEALKRGLASGYEACDCSQIVENNHRMVRGLEALGGERYKTFRIYRKTIG